MGTQNLKNKIPNEEEKAIYTCCLSFSFYHLNPNYLQLCSIPKYQKQNDLILKNCCTNGDDRISSEGSIFISSKKHPQTSNKNVLKPYMYDLDLDIFNPYILQ